MPKYIPSPTIAIRELNKLPRGWSKFRGVDGNADKLRKLAEKEESRLMRSPAAAKLRKLQQAARRAQSRAYVVREKWDKEVAELKRDIRLDGVTPGNLRRLRRICKQK